MAVTITLSDACANELRQALAQPTPPTPAPVPTPVPTPVHPTGTIFGVINWDTSRSVVTMANTDVVVFSLTTPGQILLNPGVIGYSEYPPGVATQRYVTLKDSAGNILLQTGGTSGSLSVQVGGAAPNAYVAVLQPSMTYYVVVEIPYGKAGTNYAIGIGFGKLPS